jgi:hypothetical protein
LPVPIGREAIRRRGLLAAKSKRFGPDHPDTIQARRELLEARLADHIRQVVDGAPPLTAEQRDRLAVLLQGRPEARAS